MKTAMSDIPTWHERAMAHPDHQSGMISEDMIRARMAEEISDLRAEVERLTRDRDEARAEVERLRADNEKLRAERRERIATAVLQGMLSDPEVVGVGSPYGIAACAANYADILIALLDKEPQS